MRKTTIIITIVISILSFGMIDSATSESPKWDRLEAIKQSEILRKEAEELKIKQYHQDLSLIHI